MTADVQDHIDTANNAFWNTLCGTTFANSIGVTDDSPASLGRFDEWFFKLYPYLEDHVRSNELAGKRVLEVGLGYGSVGQRLAQAGADYMGLDIADGPVEMMRHRLRQAKLPGDATCASILNPPFPPASFDAVIAIGCLHHTGDLKGAIAQCRRLLKPGGRLTMMVYYAYSYRQWGQAKAETRHYLLRELMGYRGVVAGAKAAHRAAYDTDLEGNAAPHTDWISQTSLRRLFRDAGFRSSSTKLENIDQAGFHKDRPREEWLETMWPQIWGLDLYATAET
ncbi:MAG TPA: class I SAM-dependent methyltransferase [Caulobacterales bacterium]|nr:class I SAM-dependent methyltransferase [Caulobacterales bacterium]